MVNTTKLLQNDIPDQETEYDSVNIDDETDDNDDGSNLTNLTVIMYLK